VGTCAPIDSFSVAVVRYRLVGILSKFLHGELRIIQPVYAEDGEAGGMR
jgi:hypothetical protein